MVLFETNLGIALVCDKICNYDTLSKSLKDVIGTKLLKTKKKIYLIIELRDYIFKYILFLDVNLK